MKILIAVTSCHAFRERADAVRATWAQCVPAEVDLRFFLGQGGAAPRPDEVHLDVPDTYAALPAKVQAMRRWALEHGYDGVLKVDDDTYLRPERFLASGFEKSAYRGRLRGPSGGYPAPYCSGFAYWMDRATIAALVATRWNGDTAEDRFAGNALWGAGVVPDHDARYAVVSSTRNAKSFYESPRVGNSVIASCEYKPEAMQAVHRDFATLRSTYTAPQIPPGPLDRVAIMIKTFLRDGFLFACLKDLDANFPDAKVVIVDDGWESVEKIRKYAELQLAGHATAWLPFDSGFGAKANAALAHCDREYVLVGSDDFNFGDPRARTSVERMVAVLDADRSIDVASGRVNGRQYESLLELENNKCREVRGFRETREAAGIRYHLCDLTVNFSLIRRPVFERVRWDGDVKIGGGEHGAFFIDLKRAGFQVCYVEGANINELRGMQGWKDVRYDALRGRAKAPGRPCLKKRGIDHYVLAEGVAEIC